MEYVAGNFYADGRSKVKFYVSGKRLNNNGIWDNMPSDFFIANLENVNDLNW